MESTSTTIKHIKNRPPNSENIGKSFFYGIVGERFGNGSGQLIALSPTAYARGNIVLTKKQPVPGEIHRPTMY